MPTERQILRTMQKEIEKRNDFFIPTIDYADGTQEDVAYIWVGGQGNLIGNLSCHYEFIFHNETELHLEVHFEERTDYTSFSKLTLNPDFEYQDWEINGEKVDNARIVVKQSISVEKRNLDEIVKEAIDLLEKLDETIGKDLAKICDELKPKADLSGNGTIVNEINYKQRYKNYKHSFYTKHGDIQEALQKNLVKNKAYDEVGIERTLGDIRVDVLGINKNGETDPRKYTYDIYEVKPYESPTECIREALGQLLYYKYMFEKNGYKVEKLIVVGKNKLEFYDRQYLEIIQKSFPIDYITPY